MEGCSAPLVVKFADTQKEKEQKKVQHMQVSIYSTIKGSGTTPTPSLGITPAGIAANESITSSLTGTNGTAATAASLPINFGLSNSGSLTHYFYYFLNLKSKIDAIFSLFLPNSTSIEWFSHCAKCNSINIKFIAYNQSTSNM